MARQVKHLEPSKEFRMVLAEDLRAQDGIDAADDEENEAGVADGRDRVGERSQDCVKVLVAYQVRAS